MRLYWAKSKCSKKNLATKISRILSIEPLASDFGISRLLNNSATYCIGRQEKLSLASREFADYITIGEIDDYA